MDSYGAGNAPCGFPKTGIRIPITATPTPLASVFAAMLLEKPQGIWPSHMGLVKPVKSNSIYVKIKYIHISVLYLIF